MTDAVRKSANFTCIISLLEVFLPLLGVLLPPRIVGAAPGDQDPTFPETIAENISSMAVEKDGTVWLAIGRLSSFRGENAQAIVKLLPGGNVDPEFSLGAGFEAFSGSTEISVLLPDSHHRIYVGVAFDKFNGVESHLVRLFSNGSLDPEFTPNLQRMPGRLNRLLKLSPDGMRLYVDQGFDRADGKSVSGLFRLEAETGRLDGRFVVSATGGMISGETNDGRVFLTGAPDGLGGLLRLWQDGSEDQSLVPELTQESFGFHTALPLPDGRILAYYSQSGQVVQMWSEGVLDSTFQKTIGHQYRGEGAGIVRLSDGRVLVGGHTLLLSSGEIDPDFVLQGVSRNQIHLFGTDERNVWVAWYDQELFAYRVTMHTLGEAEGDDIGAVDFGFDRFIADEGSKSARAVLRRSGSARAAASATCRLVAESAVEGMHYTGVEVTAAFAPDEREAGLTVPLIDDEFPGAERTFKVELTSVTGARMGTRVEAQVVVLDDDRAGVFSISNLPLDYMHAYRTEGIDLSKPLFITRTAGAEGAVDVSYEVLPLTAEPEDFAVLEGTVHFASGQTTAELPTGLVDDEIAEESPETARFVLTASSAGLIGYSKCTLSIWDDDFPRHAEVAPFRNDGPAVVRTLALLPDHRIVAGGVGEIRFSVHFPDGSRDNTWNTQPDATVRGLAVDTKGRILAGWEFTSWGGQKANHIARLTPEGMPDPAFFASGDAGPNGTVHSVRCLPDGRIMICGEFTRVGGKPVTGVARLFDDGSVDPAFLTPTLRGDGETPTKLEVIEVLPDGRIYLAGESLVVSDLEPSSRRLVRLHADGAVDSGFDADPALFSNSIKAVLPLPDGSVLVGGEFATLFGGRLLKLKNDGTLDQSFKSYRSGANDSVRVLLGLPDGRILVGGFFTTLNRVSTGAGAIIDGDGVVRTTFVGLSPYVFTAVFAKNQFAYFGGNPNNRNIRGFSVLPPPHALYESGALWARYHFSPNPVVEETFWIQDNDGDGLTNFDEYQLATDPLTPDLPRQPIVRWSATGILEIKFHGNWAALDVNFELQSSMDGIEWLPMNRNEWSMSRDGLSLIASIPIMRETKAIRLFRGK